ncbi:beta-ketoacyl synthase [Streptomyces sp. CNQ085]|uniref:beta-ketoacyl-[acyl-carrier-protein] synthase family protein n=1 Tax=Streptomyces sp. CNQ085 TaxID=2886944 RepID=UPI001F50488D|nr:beta-ketoacyl-[acyl-carrier-protein] synthase family protein [Streptomyces sp. CNQ085]MCI0386305.1 beta-ketoacyl-[acyl-carrier-protein] synthase family protein [Streptomyces sp. CNQ085]
MSTGPDDVLITGYGLFTGHGFGEHALHTGIFAGRPAFRPVERFDTSAFRGQHAAAHGTEGLPLPGTTPDARRVPGQREALAACGRAALDMAGLGGGPLRADVLIGTQGDHTGVTSFWNGGEGPAGKREVTESLPAALPDLVADDLELSGRRQAFVNACVASTNALMHSARLIRSGRAETVLCAGAYLVEPEFFAKFDSGRAFSTDGRVRPFSADRQGLLLGDGVAALVLEPASRVRTRGGEPLARVSGWGMASDAHHVCRPHPQGAGLAAAVEAALCRASAAPEGIDYVNAHGTGTRTNDPAETAALHRALGPAARRTPVSSTKSTTGHMLEGSGAVEAVIGVYALRHGILPPTAGYTAPDPACDLDWIPNEPRTARVRRVLSTNAAFGGLNAAIVLERP